MHISTGLSERFVVASPRAAGKGKLGSEFQHVPYSADAAPDRIGLPEDVGEGSQVGHLTQAIQGALGTVHFGKLFKLSLLAMVVAGTAYVLLLLTGWHLFGRLYGASVTLALLFSMGAAFSELIRDKGEHEHDSLSHHADAGDRHRPGNHPSNLFTLG